MQRRDLAPFGERLAGDRAAAAGATGFHHRIQVGRHRIPAAAHERGHVPGPECLDVVDADPVQEARGRVRGQGVVEIEDDGDGS